MSGWGMVRCVQRKVSLKYEKYEVFTTTIRGKLQVEDIDLHENEEKILSISDKDKRHFYEIETGQEYLI